MEKRVANALTTSHLMMLLPKGNPIQLHGFSDASEKAYSGVVYLKMEDCKRAIYTSLDTPKTHVALIKRLTIPRVELNGTLIMAQLLSHCIDVLGQCTRGLALHGSKETHISSRCMLAIGLHKYWPSRLLETRGE